MAGRESRTSRNLERKLLISDSDEILQNHISCPKRDSAPFTVQKERTGHTGDLMLGSSPK